MSEVAATVEVMAEVITKLRAEKAGLETRLAAANTRCAELEEASAARVDDKHVATPSNYSAIS